MSMDMDFEKSAVKYEDEFSMASNQTNKMQETGSNNSSLKDYCDHGNHSGDHGSCRDAGGNQPCFTCHSIKADFSHDHGQHIDNSFILLHKISELFEKQDLSDIQITVGHKVFHAHRLILSGSSDVFRVMLTNTSWPEARTERIVLKEESECIAVFEDFLKYMYTGNIHLTNYTVLPVLMLADKYNVRDLRAVCITYMTDHLVSTMEHNHATSWLQYAYTCCHENLAKQCYQFIQWNFHKVVNTKDYLLMDKDVLLHLLTSSDLVIPDEFTLFKGLSKWLQHQKKNYKGNVSKVDFYNMAVPFLCQIRFPMLSPVHLSQLERDPLSEYFTDFFMEKMMLALNFHMGNQREISSREHVSSQWQPRNYTNDQWSTSLTIDNFLSLPQHAVRPLLFSSPVSASQSDDNRCWEWNVDLFPKGIHFQKCIMIGLWRNLEVSGTVYDNVRLVLSTKQPDVRKVDVAILIKGLQDNVEYFKHVVQRRCMFDHDKQAFHFDHIIPFDDVNCADSSYLCGADSSSFKIIVIIKPVDGMDSTIK